MTAVVHLKHHGPILEIQIDNPPVNASCQAVRAALLQALDSVAGDPAVGAVILSCAGRTFVAGADISEFDLPHLPQPDPNAVHEAIEALDRPVVAALHGTVLGGGLELALACHGRVALDTTKLGLPEVKLGVIPGSGGTLRLPRLIGLKPALDMIVGGAPIGAVRAHDLGLIDRVVADDLIGGALALARALMDSDEPLQRTSRLPLDADSFPPQFFADYRATLPPPEKGGHALNAAACAVEAGTTMPFAPALSVERSVFNACKGSPESRALRHLFFAEREAARIPGLPTGGDVRAMESVGVIGAGTMGGGIAMNFANAGIPVTIVEINAASLERGLGLVRKNYEASAAKGRITPQQVEARMALVHGSLDYADIAGCDLVIEAAFEDMEVKRGICARLGDVCKPGAIIATNTSSLDVDVLADASGRPEHFLGLHFFSPANVMRLLEIVRGDRTAPDVLSTMLALAKKIGKTPVVSGVCFGFIGNRMLEGYLREAEFLLMEGASASQIDRAIEAMGMAMGPCRMIDMAGVDVAAKVILERKKSGGLPDDPAYRAVVQELHARGRMGQKTSSGYYRYEGRTPLEDDELGVLCRDLASRFGVRRRTTISDQEIVERCLLPLINEGGFILDEGIAYRPGDIDVVWVNGYGFPAFKGGPMHMAATEMGPERVVSLLAHYGARLGDSHRYWAPAEWWVRQAASGAKRATAG